MCLADFLYFYRTRSCKMNNLCNDEERTKSFDVGETCGKCSISWTEGDFSIKINKINISLKRAQKIMRLNNDKSNPKKQRISKKWTKLANNTIVIYIHYVILTIIFNFKLFFFHFF